MNLIGACIGGALISASLGEPGHLGTLLMGFVLILAAFGDEYML